MDASLLAFAQYFAACLAAQLLLYGYSGSSSSSSSGGD